MKRIVFLDLSRPKRRTFYRILFTRSLTMKNRSKTKQFRYSQQENEHFSMQVPAARQFPECGKSKVFWKLCGELLEDQWRWNVAPQHSGFTRYPTSCMDFLSSTLTSSFDLRRESERADARCFFRKASFSRFMNSSQSRKYNSNFITTIYSQDSILQPLYFLGLASVA